MGGLAAALFLLRAGVRDVTRLRAAVARCRRSARASRSRPTRCGCCSGSGSRTRCWRSPCRSRCRGSSGAGRTGACCSRSVRDEGEARYGRRTSPSTARDLLSGAGRRAARTAWSRSAGTSAASTAARSCSPTAPRGAFDALVGADGIHSVVRAAIARRRVARVHGAGGLPGARARGRGAGVRAPAGVLDLARAAPALRALPGLGRRAGQPRDREPGGRLARGVVDGARRGRRLPRRVRGLGRGRACS